MSSPESFLNQEFNLAHKRVAVIGGSGVLGRAIAAGFLKAGCRVAISSTRKEKAEKTACELGSPNCVALSADALSKPSLEAARDKLVSLWGGVDVLVNAAGGNNPNATVAPGGSYFELDPAAIEEVWKLNFMAGAVLPIQVFGEQMRKQTNGVSIINITSMSALNPITRVVAYSAAKAAVDNLTRWLAVEFAGKYGRRFRVNSIAPGFFLTEQNRFLLTDEKTGEITARGKTILDHTPFGEFGQPEELQGACLWLASDAARFVTGITIPVDGGFSAFSGV